MDSTETEGSYMVSVDRVVNTDTGEELPDGGAELGEGVMELIQRGKTEEAGPGKYVTRCLGYEVHWSVGRG